MSDLRYLLATGSSLLGARPDFGIMVSPRTRSLKPIQEGRRWASDCDAYSKTISFSDEAYYAHLVRMEPYASQCEFIVMPDVPGDGDATRSMFEIGDDVAYFNFPLAYVLQDGCETHGDFPAGCRYIFLGGTDTFRQAHGAALLRQAREEGYRTHCGRVNSAVRMRNMVLLEADSADGTHLAYIGLEKGKKKIGGWLNGANAPKLFGAADICPLGTPERRQNTRQIRAKEQRNTGHPALFAGIGPTPPDSPPRMHHPAAADYRHLNMHLYTWE